MPESKNKHNTEVLNVRNEPVPSKWRGLFSQTSFINFQRILFTAFIETGKEENSSSLELDPSQDPALERQRVQNRVAKLLKKLHNQILERNLK